MFRYKVCVDYVVSVPQLPLPCSSSMLAVLATTLNSAPSVLSAKERYVKFPYTQEQQEKQEDSKVNQESLVLAQEMEFKVMEEMSGES